MYIRRGRFQKQSPGWVRLSAIGLGALLVVFFLAQTVFAKTYVVTDGDRVITYTTTATSPEEVLDQLGLPLRQYDTYTTRNGAITVRRAPSVTIHYHGKATKATTSAKTVGELLTQLELDVAGEDVVSHGMEEPVTDGMELHIDQVETREERYSVTLEKEITYCQDPGLPQGTQKVLTPGRDGEAIRLAQVTYTNGLETKRQVRSDTILQSPVTEVVAVGTGSNDPRDLKPVIGDDYILLPSGERLTYYRKDHVRATAYTHTDPGCDMTTATGTTVHWGTVAVDPRHIPYGTRMFIMSNDGSYVYGIATAEDCGGDIKGDRMDLYMPTLSQCMEFGRRRCTIYFLGDGS